MWFNKISEISEGCEGQRGPEMPAFLEAQKDLKRSMSICGYNDYEAEASAFLDNLEQLKEESRHGKNDPAGKAVQGQSA